MKNELLSRWLAGARRRKRVLIEPASETLRWLHSDGDPLRVDQFGEQYWFYWYGAQAPNAEEWRTLEEFARQMGWQRWLVQVRAERGRSGGAEELIRHGPIACAPVWTAREHHLKFEFRIDNGLSPGLFLDQRHNRAWVKANAKDRDVLNLFCYTGGFSVMAAAGGARRVVSVDLSKALIERTRGNFLLNELATDPHEFRAIDAGEYLRWAHKKALFFDLVICDPPSFSRSKAGVFSIDKELEALVQLLLAVTAPGGRVLFSLNYEKWTETAFLAKLKTFLKGARLERTPEPDFDYEAPGLPRNMKSVFIVRE